MVSHASLILLGLVCGLILVGGVLWIVRRTGVLDRPNHRSSHVDPTPTLGGIAFVLVMLAHLLTATTASEGLGWGLFWALLALAAVSLWDDLANASSLLRLSVHIAASLGVLVALDVHAAYPAWLFGVLLIALVWLINLYNFMDGIDGYAAVQCLVFAVGAQWLGAGVPGWLGQALWLLCGVAVAFLAFNWPPARIFMGDVGSSFLGLYIGACILIGWQQGSLPMMGSLILLAGFWFDASYTLCVRIATGQRFFQAHRLHLYQQLARARGHRFTTLALLGFGALWLLPLALLSQRYPDYASGCLVASVAPIALACVVWRAGLAREA
ncbi:MAG: glycosyltransferase family 4 protein [Pseudomonadota bacterium]